MYHFENPFVFFFLSLEQRRKALEKLEAILTLWGLKKKYEEAFGDTLVTLLNNDSGRYYLFIFLYNFINNIFKINNENLFS